MYQNAANPQAAPQSYGYGYNPQPAPGYGGGGYGYKEHQDYGKEWKAKEDYPKCVGCWCKDSSIWKRIDTWCVFLCGFGGFICFITTFLPYWRHDEHGTTELEKTWYYPGFNTRSYGLIHVRGSWSQSWVTLSQAACDVRNVGQLTGLGTYAISIIAETATLGAATTNCDGNDLGVCCSKSTECQGAFNANMHLRCQEYQTMARISMVAMAGTFLSFILIMGGVLLTCMSKRKKSGGIAFGLWMFAGVLLMIVNLAWTLASDNSFKEIGRAAWYPYPCLAVAFYMHTFGYLLVLGSNGVFGYIIMPSVWAYDPAQEKLDRLKNKQEKRMMREQAMAQKKAELQAIMAGQAQPYPPPPGYGQQQYGYGQQPVPQQGVYQQPTPMGFQSDGGVTYAGGQGGAPVAPAGPGDFGLGAPAGGTGQAPTGGDFGLGAPPQGQAPTGGGQFGLGPPGGYGVAPAAGGYGVAPAAPAAGGYGSQEATVPSRPGGGSGGEKKNYNWPAFSGNSAPPEATPQQRPGVEPWNAMPGPPPQVGPPHSGKGAYD